MIQNLWRGLFPLGRPLSRMKTCSRFPLPFCIWGFVLKINHQISLRDWDSFKTHPEMALHQSVKNPWSFHICLLHQGPVSTVCRLTWDSFRRWWCLCHQGNGSSLEVSAEFRMGSFGEVLKWRTVTPGVLQEPGPSSQGSASVMFPRPQGDLGQVWLQWVNCRLSEGHFTRGWNVDMNSQCILAVSCVSIDLELSMVLWAGHPVKASGEAVFNLIQNSRGLMAHSFVLRCRRKN